MIGALSVGFSLSRFVNAKLYSPIEPQFPRNV